MVVVVVVWGCASVCVCGCVFDDNNFCFCVMILFLAAVTSLGDTRLIKNSDEICKSAFTYRRIHFIVKT